MGLNLSSKRDAARPRESGIALFMVISAVAVLAILVTEFTYIAQINQKMAFDALDQVKAHYLAKSGLKLSLLRLKAYQNVKDTVAKLGGGGGPAAPGTPAIPGIPKAALEKIWSFPFFYPIPTNIPGLGMSDRDAIDKFQKESGLDGKFSAAIESESSKYNLNLILAAFAPTPTASPSPSPAPGAPPVTGANPNPNPNPNPSAAPSFSPEEARKSLGDYLFQIFRAKSESDPEFASEYRDFKLDDLIDALIAWADPSYESKNPATRDFQWKRGPYYSASELHMIPGMDDRLFELFAPALTTSTTPGINVNTMKEATLRALVPKITDEEVKEFFKFRDSEEEDNFFKNPDEFFKYLAGNVAGLGGESGAKQLQDSLAKRNIRIVVDESQFKITVKAQVNQSTRLIEAWVTLSPPKKPGGPTGSGPNPRPNPQPNAQPTTPGNPAPGEPDPGLKITFMRFL